MQLLVQNESKALSLTTVRRPLRHRVASVKAFMRQWGLHLLTALIVPGGIAIVLLMLWRERA